MEQLINLLRNYKTGFNEEKAMVEKTIAFVNTHPHCFERTLEEGHITASSWITNPAIEMALFTHHKKIDKWLQLGGHCDGNKDVKAVALQEASEESGISDFNFKSDAIFDVDIHLIPAHKTTKAHYHYDIRFWLTADSNQPLVVSNESKDLKWLPLNEIENYNSEASIMRMVKKSSQGKVYKQI